LAPGDQIEPPRLGHVGDAQLYINRRLEFAERAPEPEAGDEMFDLGTERVPKTRAPAPADPRILKMLGLLRQVALLVICLLAAILIVTLLKR
jgi:hypothetical protein